MEFNGYLVRVDSEDGWRWVSSLSRSDRGNHSCELVWVENFRVVPGWFLPSSEIFCHPSEEIAGISPGDLS